MNISDWYAPIYLVLILLYACHYRKGLQKSMPKPLPEYVPPAIREILLARYPGGLMALSEAMDSPYTSLVHLLKCDHYHLRAFVELAGRLDVRPGKLAEIFAVDIPNRRTWLANVLGIESTTTISLSGGTADAYLYKLLSGQSGNQVYRKYLPLATTLNMSLEELSESLIPKDMELIAQ